MPDDVTGKSHATRRRPTNLETRPAEESRVGSAVDEQYPRGTIALREWLG